MIIVDVKGDKRYVEAEQKRRFSEKLIYSGKHTHTHKKISRLSSHLARIVSSFGRPKADLASSTRDCVEVMFHPTEHFASSIVFNQFFSSRRTHFSSTTSALFTRPWQKGKIFHSSFIIATRASCVPLAPARTRQLFSLILLMHFWHLCAFSRPLLLEILIDPFSTVIVPLFAASIAIPISCPAILSLFFVILIVSGLKSSGDSRAAHIVYTILSWGQSAATEMEPPNGAAKKAKKKNGQCVMSLMR